MNEEIKAAIDGIKSLVEKMRKDNDKALTELADKGHVDSIVAEQVNRINTAIDAKTEDLQKRMDEFEKVQNRLEIGREPETPDALHAELALFNDMKYMVWDGKGKKAEPIDIEALKAYKDAFPEFLRVGLDAMPNELRAGMHVGSDPKGGYLVTPDVAGKIVKLVYESSNIRKYADVRVLGKEALEGKRDLDEATASWADERDSVSETDHPDLGAYRIPAHELRAMPALTQKELEDAELDMESWLSEKVAERFIRAENTAFVTGNTPVRPRGFATYAHGVPSASVFNRIEQSPSGASGAFKAAPNGGDVFYTVMGLLKDPFHAAAIWAMTRTVLATARQLKDSNGAYIWQPSFNESPAGEILGYPIARWSDMAELAADSLSIAFGDFFQGYQIVDRKGITVLRDPYTGKPDVRYYTRKRVGGDVKNFEAIKLIKFATSV